MQCFEFDDWSPNRKTTAARKAGWNMQCFVFDDWNPSKAVLLALPVGLSKLRDLQQFSALFIGPVCVKNGRLKLRGNQACV